jgi:4-amino-4-deoxy-L-arabinose transferase-like glycosyltransferase
MHKSESAGAIYRNLGPLAVVVLKIISDWRRIACYPWYLVFGLATACAILTKSILGLLPLTIVGAFLIYSRQWREFINLWFVSGCLIALLLGFSWHLVNWQHYGQGFIDIHFGYLLGNQGGRHADNPLYYLGYAKDFCKNYWPWLPITLIGLANLVNAGLKKKTGYFYCFSCGLYSPFWL